jgi:hypothetical protein
MATEVEPDQTGAPARRWLVYEQPDERFPYLLLIEHLPGRFLAYQVAEKWPGPGKSIFCIARGELAEDGLPTSFPVADSCGIQAVKRYGRKLTVILDRPNRKRSWFITLERKYKNDPRPHLQTDRPRQRAGAEEPTCRAEARPTTLPSSATRANGMATVSRASRSKRTRSRSATTRSRTLQAGSLP